MLHNVRIAAVGTRRAAMSFLCLDRVPVIICERDLPDGNWKDILGDTAAFPNPPVLVVTSRLADEYLWAEVLNLGGYDLLAKPFREPEVKRVLAAALRQNTSQTQKPLVAGAAGFA
jgi:DNA-binding response OmpR family regulator